MTYKIKFQHEKNNFFGISKEDIYFDDMDKNIINLINEMNISNYYVIALYMSIEIEHDLEIYKFIKKLIKNNNNLHLKILFLNAREGITYKYNLNNMCDRLHKDFKIPYNDMIVISGACHQFDSPIISCNALHIAFCRNTILDFKDITKNPTHHFISLSKVPRNHRVIATGRLLERNLERYGYISCGSNGQEVSYNNLIPKKFLNAFPLYLDGVHAGYTNKERDGSNEKINGAFINLVLETGYEENERWSVPLLTEKTAKPFSWGQVPIFVSHHNTIPYIRELKFDLFDDIIDHSYDDEVNPIKRIFKSVKQLEKICEKPLEYWIDYKKNNIDRFIKNRKIAEDLHNGVADCIFKNKFELAIRC
jgi:hypothetical protein